MDILEYAKEMGFTYNPNTGEVTTPYGKVVEKKRRLKTKSKIIYITCCIKINNKYKYFPAHRFAWYYMTGEVPNIIDHIEHTDDPIFDNRFSNLRNVNIQINSFNTTCSKGVYFDSRRNKFRSCITLNSKNIHLGMFITENEAHLAYLEAKKIYHKL